jgi:hypothetical protein
MPWTHAARPFSVWLPQPQIQSSRAWQRRSVHGTWANNQTRQVCILIIFMNIPIFTIRPDINPLPIANKKFIRFANKQYFRLCANDGLKILRMIIQQDQPNFNLSELGIATAPSWAIFENIENNQELRQQAKFIHAISPVSKPLLPRTNPYRNSTERCCIFQEPCIPEGCALRKWAGAGCG